MSYKKIWLFNLSLPDNTFHYHQFHEGGMKNTSIPRLG